MRIRRLLMLILVMITTAAAFPAAAAADYEGQSSFEYKKYEKPEQYMQALDKSMHRVYTALGPSIDDESTVPIPGLVSTYTAGEGEPVISSSYVPQGLCSADKYILVTSYHAKKRHRSVIYAIDTETGSLASTLIVPNTYHLGGIAFDGNYIWLTGDTSDKYKGEPFVQYIRYADFLEMVGEPVHEMTEDEISGPVYIKNKPSFLECDNGILWVGTYAGRGSAKKGSINGYRIIEKENGPQLGTFMYAVITGIDSSAQGADIDGDHLYVSSSYGGANEAVMSSFITTYNIAPAVNGDTDLNVTERELKRVEVPKMNEEIIVTGSEVLMNFEAAADCWKKVVLPTDRILAVKATVWR